MRNRRRIFALVASVAAAGTLLLPSSPAQAYSKCPAGTECGWDFYADAAHTQFVGVHSTNCQGVVLNSGRQTGFSVYFQQGC